MARYKSKDIEDLEEPIAEVMAVLDELIVKHDGDLQAELRQLQNYAYIIQGKISKLCKLRDFIGYKFAVFDEGSTEPRPASYDESMRLIMGYQRGNVLDIMKQWTVVDGEWVKRPQTNPDGSKVQQ